MRILRSRDVKIPFVQGTVLPCVLLLNGVSYLKSVLVFFLVVLNTTTSNPLKTQEIVPAKSHHDLQ